MSWRNDRREWLSIVMGAVLGICCLTQMTHAEAPVKKVLFIGIDGCRFDALRAAKTTHLEKLIAEGAYSDHAHIFPERPTSSDTVSGPGWSSLLTGVWADKHGVLNNEFKDHHLEQFPHVFRHIRHVRPHAFLASVVDWEPIHELIIRDADVATTIQRPIPSADPKKPLRDYAMEDQLVAQASVKILGESDPTLLFVYLGQVDETGHAHGFHSSVPQYIQAIQLVDGHVGELLAAVDARPQRAAEDWLILVSSDHGGLGTGHGGGRQEPQIYNSFIIVSGDAARRGALDGPTYLVDVPATALAHLGIAADPAWGLDGKAVGLK